MSKRARTDEARAPFLHYFTNPTLISLALSHAWRDVMRLCCVCPQFAAIIGSQDYWRIVLPNMLRELYPKLDARLVPHVDPFYVFPDTVPGVPRDLGPWWKFLAVLKRGLPTTVMQRDGRLLSIPVYRLALCRALEFSVTDESVWISLSDDDNTKEFICKRRGTEMDAFFVRDGGITTWADAYSYVHRKRWRGGVRELSAEPSGGTKVEVVEGQGYFY